MGYNTKQGELITSLLKSSGGRHLTAEDISHILGERGCPVGKATVYRHLEKMLREGSASTRPALQKYTPAFLQATLYSAAVMA